MTSEAEATRGDTVVAPALRFRAHKHLWALFDGTPAHAPPGRLTRDEDGRVACHLCGRWFHRLGSHLRSHGWTAARYREAVGLSPTDSLDGEAQRSAPGATTVRDADEFEVALTLRSAHESGLAAGYRSESEKGERAIGAAPTAFTRVAVTDGQVSGCYRLHADPCAIPPACLSLVFVHEQWRRRGVGAALVRDACRLAGELGHADIEVVSHPPAERFFLAVGARRVGTHAATRLVGWSRPILRLDAERAPQAATTSRP